jgi:hypothetical protein
VNLTANTTVLICRFPSFSSPQGNRLSEDDVKMGMGGVD